jgi:DNA-binding transcriptional regulator YiaG
MEPSEIKSCRGQLGLTQQQLADEIGNHVSTVAGWEQGIARIAPSAAAYLRRRLQEHAVLKLLQEFGADEVHELLALGRAVRNIAQLGHADGVTEDSDRIAA